MTQLNDGIVGIGVFEPVNGQLCLTLCFGKLSLTFTRLFGALALEFLRPLSELTVAFFDGLFLEI